MTSSIYTLLRYMAWEEGRDIEYSIGVRRIKGYSSFFSFLGALDEGETRPASMGIIEWARAQKALTGIQNSESFLHVFRIEHIQLSLLFLFFSSLLLLLPPWGTGCVCMCYGV